MEEGTGISLYILVGSILFGLFAVMSATFGEGVHGFVGGLTDTVISSELFSGEDGEGIPDELGGTTVYASMEGLYRRFDNVFLYQAAQMGWFNSQWTTLFDTGTDVVYTEYDSEGNIVGKHTFEGGSKSQTETLYVYVNDINDLPQGYTVKTELLDDDGNVLYKVLDSPEKVYAEHSNGLMLSRPQTQYTYMSPLYYDTQEMRDSIGEEKQRVYDHYGDDLPEYLRP